MAKQQPTPERTTPPARADWFTPVDELHRRIDRLFDEVANGWGVPDLWRFPREAGLLGRAAGIDVCFDIAEGDKAIEMTAEVPGMSEDDIDIEVAGDMLTIKGEKKAEEEKREKNSYLSERRYGAFRRSFHLPETVDTEKIEAAFDKGVLKLTLPKRPEAQQKTKKISVKSK